MQLFSTGARNALNDNGWGPLFDGGNGRIAIYAGTDPTDANDAISGTLLATLTMPSDVFPASSGGVLTANAITGDSSADATGTAAFAVLYRSTDTALGSAAGTSDRRIILTNVTASGGGGELTLDTTSIIATAPVSLTGWTITWPASA